MRKWNMLLLTLALLCLPAIGAAEELGGLFSAVYEGVSEGLEAGAATLEEMDSDLTLALSPEGARIEAGKTLRLTITAGNPRPQDTPVSITLNLPERLSAAPDATWDVVLPAARLDPETGKLAPSVTAFTREIALAPGGGSEDAVITAEMSMGTRFYRAQTAVSLCVPDIRVQADVEGVPEGRLRAGDVFAYRIDVTNGGAAPKDVALELSLPDGVTLAQPLPQGFAEQDGVVRGMVRAEAAAQTPFTASLRLPVRVAEDVLEGDADALRLLPGTLRADGERVALPRVQVCGPRVSARLMLDEDCLEAGETAALSVVLVNKGLAEADVNVSCVLPEGLSLADVRAATPGEAAVLPPDDGALPAMTTEQGALRFTVRLEAAEQTQEGIVASTRVLELPVKVNEDTQERLIGASLAWSVGEGPAQLAEAAAMQVVRPSFMGLAGEEWSGVLWASLLLIVTVACLYAAVRKDEREQDYCLD